MAAPNLQELHLCTLHLLHPGVLRSALVNLRALRVLVLDYVEAYEKVRSSSTVLVSRTCQDVGRCGLCDAAPCPKMQVKFCTLTFRIVGPGVCASCMYLSGLSCGIY